MSDVAFITCVNSTMQYKRCTEHLSFLKIPFGYTVEHRAIYKAISMASGYNLAMKQSKSKYKVYLHQDVCIIDPMFIQNIVDLFDKYPCLGLLGVVGSSNIPNDGVWWHSKMLYGKVHEKTRLLRFRDVTEDYESVKAVDGLIMITQYDIPWREDLFTGWHFYDVSQSLQFIEAGFEVGIPKQINHWCVHDCGKPSVKNFDRYRRWFVREYRQFLGEN